jgi:hypothetical protein
MEMLFTCEQLVFIASNSDSTSISLSQQHFNEETPIAGVEVQIEEMDRLKYDRVEESGGWSEFEELAAIYSPSTISGEEPQQD